jgi:hypothetical protein
LETASKLRRGQLHNAEKSLELQFEKGPSEESADVRSIQRQLEDWTLCQLFMSLASLVQVVHRILSIWEPEGRYERYRGAPGAVQALVFYQTGILSEALLKRLKGVHLELFAAAVDRSERSTASASSSTFHRRVGEESIVEHFDASIHPSIYLSVYLSTRLSVVQCHSV